MSFASTIVDHTIFGDKRIAIGAFTQASGDTGGAITTGLGVIQYFHASYMVTHSDASGVVTITTADPGAAQSGYWLAIGA